MARNTRFLAVISVLEGRGFPKRPQHMLIVEAKFDGELLATDPVSHVDNPDFNQELAWELDKKSLSQHRLQRSSIKILCFAFDAASTLKELIGYVMLDLRGVSHNKQVAKWYPLLHSKYNRNKPELRLALYLDDNLSNQNQTKVPATSSAIESNAVLPPKTLVPILNEKDGFYQIGPSETCEELFVLSVTIAYASNLAYLIPSNTVLKKSSDFFFYYSLLGNDVTNEPFSNLMNPNFPAERASVKLRTNVQVLSRFLSMQPGLKIYLCCGEQTLGSSEVPLSNLLHSNSTEIYMKPVVVEGSFQMIPVNKTKEQVSQSSSESPSIGVSVVLRKDDMAVKSPIKTDVSGLSPCTEATDESPTTVKNVHKDTDKNTDYHDLLENQPQNTRNKNDQESNKKDNEVAEIGLESMPFNTKIPKSVTLSLKQGVDGNISLPPQAHHFTFSLDLRSIRENHSVNTLCLFLRYMYPFFGSAAPIFTHPPVQIQKGSEVLLPQSFCAFDFACTTQQLQDTFSRIPLVVEVWHRDKSLSKDVLMGTTKPPLTQLVCADRSRIMSSAGVTGWRQELNDRIPVVSADGKVEKCAEVSVVLSLEDWGPIGTGQQVKNSPEPAAGQQKPPVPEAGSARETTEYQAALELEVWKESQEREFEKKLKMKEIAHMKSLTLEFKKRDTEREVLTQKKLTEYKQMEDQLRKTLSDLEKREKKLALNEHEVSKLRSDLHREHERKLQEMREASRRLKEDCDHQVELQKMKFKEVEEMINKYKQELADSEKRYKGLEREFQLFKENQSNTPEVRLHSQINVLAMEKMELERKLDATAKSKIHYKQQWGQALKELAKLKQKEQEAAKMNLQRQQQELEQMRLRYLAAEEKEVTGKENRELEEIKNQINKLKQMEEERVKNTSDQYQSSIKDVNGKSLNFDLNGSYDEHISRLVEERDTLLRTGVYTTQDKIIAELDRQIREALQPKS